jgi:ABC-2 type transport system ATP-binding protein
MSAIVQAENVSRFYGLYLGLNNVSFTIRPGITGIVGPNGAGKTTLFRLLTGQIKPDSGSLSVFGQTVWNNPAVQARLAYCPESETMPAGLGPLDWLQALAMISGRSAREADHLSRQMLARVKLAPEHWKKRLTLLSKGMKQRVKLAQCLLHGADLIILDEPMNGLDPMGREDFNNVLRQLASEGVSIVISSHILHDLESLCGDFILLRWGRMVGSENESVSSDAQKRWPASTTIRCNDPERLARFLFEKKLVRGFEIDDDTLQVQWRDPADFYQKFSALLMESGVEVYEVRSTETLLERATGVPHSL